MSWADYTSTEKLGAVALGLSLNLSQADIGKQHGTTASAINGFINRNSSVLGVLRRAPDPPEVRTEPHNPSKPKTALWTESNLTEKWERKARILTQPATPPGRPSKLTEDDKRYVARMWKDGTKIAAIAAEMDCSEKTIKNEVRNQIRAGKLRTRRPNIGRDKLILFRLQLDPELNAKVYAGAKRRGSTKADYIRSLIRRDNP